MLLVKTKIGSSLIHGIGLFADQFIAKGTVTWKVVYPFDLKVGREDVLALPEPARDLFFRYSYYSKYSNKCVLCFDNDRFINHSEEPNIIESEFLQAGEEASSIAARDIYPGEEMTCDYRSFDNDYEFKIEGRDIFTANLIHA